MITDEEIIDLFYSRSELAVQQLDRKYGKLCHRLSYRILNNRQDEEECVNDAYLAVWNSIPPAKPDPLQAYVCKIVRNLSLKLFYRKNAARRNSSFEIAMEELETCLSAPETVESEIETRELTRMIEHFLETLAPKERAIFLQRYWFSASYAEIAKSVGISEKNVSVCLTRIRGRLKDYLKEREVLV